MMKRKKRGIVLSVILVLLVTSCFARSTVWAQTVSENEMQSQMEYLGDDSDMFDIFSLDWKQASDQELDRYFLKCSDEAVAAWITSLSQEEINELMKRDTVMNQTLDYYGDGDEEIGLVWGKHFDTRLAYLQAIASNTKQRGNWYSKKYSVSFFLYDGTSREDFKDMEYNQRDAYKSVVTISGVDTSKGATSRISGLTCTVSNAKYGFRVDSFSGKTSKYFKSKSAYDKAVAQSQKDGKLSFIYSDVNVRFAIDKPQGYYFDKWFKDYRDNRYTYITDLFAPSQVSEGQNFKLGNKTIYGVGYVSGDGKIDELDESVAKTVTFNMIVNMAVTDKEETSDYGYYDNIYGMEYYLEMTPCVYGVDFYITDGKTSKSLAKYDYLTVGQTYGKDPFGKPTWYLYLHIPSGIGALPIKVTPSVSLSTGWKQSNGSVWDLTKPTQYHVITSGPEKLYGTLTDNRVKLPNFSLKAKCTIHYENGQTDLKEVDVPQTGWMDLDEKTYPVDSYYSVMGDKERLVAVFGVGKLTLPAQSSEDAYTYLSRWNVKASIWDNEKSFQPGDTLDIEAATYDIYEVRGEKKVHLFLDTECPEVAYSEKDFTGVDNQVVKGQYTLPLRDKVKFPVVMRDGYMLKGWEGYGESECKERYPAGEEIQLSSDLDHKSILYFHPVWEEKKSGNENPGSSDIPGKTDDQGGTTPGKTDDQGGTGVGTENGNGNGASTGGGTGTGTGADGQNSAAVENPGESDITDQQEYEKGQPVSFEQDGVSFQVEKIDDGCAAITIKDVKEKTKLVVPTQVKIGKKNVLITEIKKGAFKGNKKIVSITIGKEITKIGDSAFEKCINLKTVKFAKGSKLTILGKRAFQDCKSMKTITLPKNVKSIGKKAFYNCKKLSKVSIKSKKLKTVGGSAFKKCKKGIRFSLPMKKKKAYKKLLKGKY